MKKNLLIIISLVVVTIMVVLFVIFIIIPNSTPTKRETKKVSHNLFQIPGGIYYGDGFTVSQTSSEDEKTTIFNLLINDSPFKENSRKALSWLTSQGVDLAVINYVCGPSRFVVATKEEMASCTHLIK